MHAVPAQQNDITNLAILDAVLEFLHPATVTRHQANTHFEIPGRRFLGKVEHATGTRAIGSERVRHEDIKVLLDGVGEMDPAKCQRRCKNGNVAWFKAIHGLFVTVEANKFPIVRHIYLAGMRLMETLVRSIELVLKDVGHGDELLVALGLQSVRGCATPAPTTPDEGNLDSIGAGRMDVRNGNACQSGYCGSLAGGFEKVTTGGHKRVRFVHNTLSRRSGRGGHSEKAQRSVAP